MKTHATPSTTAALLPSLILAVALILTSTSAVFAHEGHDHDAPATLNAPKGGQIKSLDETLIEVVARGKDLKIHLYDKDSKPKSVAGFQVTAQTEMPRTKKRSDLPLKALETSYETSFDAKGSHRYTLILTVRDPKADHEDRLNFTIEPGNR